MAAIGTELLAITGRLEEFVADSQFTAVVLKVTQDDAATEYFMPVVLARALHRAIEEVLRWVPAAD